MSEDSTLSGRKKSWWMRPWALLVLALLGALLMFFGITGSRIASAARETATTRADVIAIFGAAEYAGHPSPVYRARLDHGYELFEKGMAPVVITTGGSALDPDFSEGGMHSCSAVSDAYHVFRIRALLEHEGVQVELAPRPESRPRHWWDRYLDRRPRPWRAMLQAARNKGPEEAATSMRARQGVGRRRR